MTYSIFNTIKSQISLVDVVNYYTTLKQAGVYWKGKCPFHQEKTGSFTVSPHINIFYCFGCHESGDVIAFIAKIENCSQLQAAHQLAEKYNITIEKTDTHTIQTNSEKYQTICRLFTQWCSYQLKQSQQAFNYIKNRGFSDAILAQFEVGYMPGGLGFMKQFLAYFQKQSLLATDLVDAGIIIQTKQSFYSPFEERIIFPIKTHTNLYCGFGGRIFKHNDERAKYYNSKEHEFFNKGATLFGLNYARSAIQEKGSVFLVEGYTDCIAMVQLGYCNTVATLGTACTTNHLKMIARYAHEMIVMYDNDHAGIKGISKIAQMCWQASIEPKVAQLPAGNDPASTLSNPNIIKQIVNCTQDIFVFFIKQVTDNYASLSLHERLGNVEIIIKIIQTIDDPLKQNLLLQHASEQLSIPFDILVKKFEQSVHEKEQTPYTTLAPAKTAKPLELGFALERKLFCTIANNFQLANKKSVLTLLSHLPSTLSAVILELKKWIENNKDDFNFQHFFESQPEEIKKQMSLIICSEQSVDEFEFEILVKELQKKWWKTIVQKFKAKIEQATRGGNATLVKQLVEEFTHLQKNMVQ